jgi:cytochrome c peroxidase
MGSPWAPKILRVGVLVISLGIACPVVAVPRDEPIKPLPFATQQDPVRVALGRRLFHDPRLSANDRVACVTCHTPEHGGADGRGRSVGFSGKATTITAPTVFNAALNFKQFWNGRADTLEQQIDMVIQNPIEMGSTWAEVVVKVSQDESYRRSFAASYREGITPTSIQDAIATYERTLTTPNSRFDRYLRGDDNAISAEEKTGYLKFKQYGCIACHQGVNVGGNMFQKFGVMGDYFAARGNPTDADLGRYLVTKEEDDRHVFKVPSLRNVALTAPYFHDGSAKTLEAAVDIMFRYQLGRTASAEDKAAIVQFLNTLTGDTAGRL